MIAVGRVEEGLQRSVVGEPAKQKAPCWLRPSAPKLSVGSALLLLQRRWRTGPGNPENCGFPSRVSAQNRRDVQNRNPNCPEQPASRFSSPFYLNLIRTFKSIVDFMISMANGIVLVMLRFTLFMKATPNACSFRVLLLPTQARSAGYSANWNESIGYYKLPLINRAETLVLRIKQPFLLSLLLNLVVASKTCRSRCQSKKALLG